MNNKADTVTQSTAQTAADNEFEQAGNLRGCLYMVIAMFCFVANDALVRSVGNELPTSQIMFLRGLFVVSLIAPFLLKAYMPQLTNQSDKQSKQQRKFSQLLKLTLSPRVLVRSLLDLAGTLAFLYALMRMPFANVAAVLQCLPLTVTLGAALFFKEPVGIWRWSAIIVGFIGMLIILRPGVEGFSYASLWLLATVVFSAARDLLSRSLPKEIPTLMVTLSTAVTISIGGLVIVLFSGVWVPPSVNQLGHLALASVFLFGAYHFIVQTMRIGEVGFVSPFRYTSLIWAGLIGWWAFGELPDMLTVTGTFIVVSMGLLTLYREQYLLKKLKHSS